MKEGQVRGRVPALQLGGHAGAVGQGEVNVVVTGDGVISGDDKARGPDDAARGHPGPCMNGYNVLRGLGDRLDQLRREVRERGFHDLRFAPDSAENHPWNGQRRTGRSASWTGG